MEHGGPGSNSHFRNTVVGLEQNERAGVGQIQSLAGMIVLKSRNIRIPTPKVPPTCLIIILSLLCQSIGQTFIEHLLFLFFINLVEGLPLCAQS